MAIRAGEHIHRSPPAKEPESPPSALWDSSLEEMDGCFAEDERLFEILCLQACTKPSCGLTFCAWACINLAPAVQCVPELHPGLSI